MLATVAGLIIGTVIAWAILVLTRASRVGAGEPRTQPAALSWLTLAFGLVATLAFALGVLLQELGVWVYLTTITAAVVAVVIGISAIMTRERYWPTWVGLVAGAVPLAFWISFALAYLFAYLLGTGE